MKKCGVTPCVTLMRGRPYFMWCRSTTPYFFTITSSLPLASPSGGGKETHHKPSPWGKVPAEQADEGPRKINAAYIFCAVPHPALSGHPPPRGGQKHISLVIARRGWPRRGNPFLCFQTFFRLPCCRGSGTIPPLCRRKLGPTSPHFT